MHTQARLAASSVDRPVIGPASPTRATAKRTSGSRQATLASLLPLLLGLPGLAFADTTHRCGDVVLKGEYVFTASGFTRAPDSLPGAPWVPKAILEVLRFNGDGTLSTPAVTVANAFGDTGAVLHPPVGAPGVYTVNEDCTGTVQFLDPNNVTYNIRVDAPRGETIRMIQTNPLDNVFQGIATRAR